MTPDINVSLTRDQALVLFEWLAREDEKGIRIEHPAEQAVLWIVEGQLESALVEVLQSDYAELVAAARERIASAEPPTR